MSKLNFFLYCQKHPLTPIVLTDKSGVQTQPNNPYLVFRRRTEKMQTRKVNIRLLTC